ncbi:MAG: serine--tRNA ligase [Chloroflexi bacterium]|nr:serine--tRNA ligase [Chloroflexota bacterium]
MLPLRFIREHEAMVRERLSARGGDIPLDALLELDSRRRQLLTKVEGLRAARKKVSRGIGNASGADREALIARTRQLTSELGDQAPELDRTQKKVDRLLLEIPMLPHASAPVGDADHPGQVHYCSGTPDPDCRTPPHDEIGRDLGILDFSRASKVAGSGFWIFRGAGARLQRALIQWMLDFQVQEHGYHELYLPALVTNTAMTNAAKLPKFAGDSYAVDNQRLWLSPTAEVALSEYHADETLDAAMLPAKYVAYAAAFRREAGAAGVETRGLRRVRQFDKIELFNVTTPDDSYGTLERMRGEAEAVIRRLGLTFRVREVPTGDLGFAAAKQYDLEVWSPGAGEWLEVSSVSNCEAFQTRRAGVRIRRPGSARTEYAHSLNGTALGLPRTYVALLENGRQADGSVAIPDVLQPYMGHRTQIEAEASWL